MGRIVVRYVSSFSAAKQKDNTNSAQKGDSTNCYVLVYYCEALKPVYIRSKS